MLGSRTKNLMETLQNSQELDAVLTEHSESFIACSLPQALEELLETKNLRRAQVIRNAMLNPIYGQQIFSGVRTPSRNKLLSIAFGMELNLQETDTLLKQQGYPQLYPRQERDAVIIYGLLHGWPLMDVNTALYEREMDTLS